MQCTLVQLLHPAFGDHANNYWWLIPNDRITPELDALLDRLHGKTTIVSAKDDVQKLLETMEAYKDCAGLTDEHATEPVKLRAGDSIVRLCQVFDATF